ARTSKLLEQSQKQAEEMADQEEEMRQNMEELRTTQEDFARREAEIQGLVNAIRISTMVMILDSSGKVIEANDKLLNALIAKEEDIIGRNHKELLSQGRSAEEYDKFCHRA
ncbi:MAG: PAS domain-containing protein, partial [bacterium]